MYIGSNDNKFYTITSQEILDAAAAEKAKEAPSTGTRLVSYLVGGGVLAIAVGLVGFWFYTHFWYMWDQ